MGKRNRITRKDCSQRRFAAIDRETTDQRLASSTKTGISIDANTAAKAVDDGRDPFEMARAASAALKGAS